MQTWVQGVGVRRPEKRRGGGSPAREEGEYRGLASDRPLGGRVPVGWHRKPLTGAVGVWGLDEGVAGCPPASRESAPALTAGFPWTGPEWAWPLWALHGPVRLD